MQSYSDFEEILLAFNAAAVDYLVIGAFAVAVYARPRATGDIDIWVAPTLPNSQRIVTALTAFGAPMAGIDTTTFCEPDIILQIGVPPIRVDILTGIDGLTFDEAWPNRVSTTIGAVPVHVISRDDLLRNKRASGRAQDLADVECLERDA